MTLLQGKAIVITGSGRGIGAACAKGAARQGASLVVNDINGTNAEQTVAEIKAEGGNAIACVADITEWEQAGRLIQCCLDTYGQIDGLVNNAAVITFGRIEDYDPETAQRLIDVNIKGTLHCSARAVKPMLARKSGSIVNVTSGAQMGLPTMGVYGATKGAVASAIYTWAMELAGTGVRVNGLSPLAATRMGGADGQQYEEMLREMQSPEANSFVVEFLLSDRAAKVNGQILRIDGEEVSLYAHPSLLLPPVVSAHWTAESLADVFERQFDGRQVPCGATGIEQLPRALNSGSWKGGGDG